MSWADDMVAASHKAFEAKGEPLTLRIVEVETVWGVRTNRKNGVFINWYETKASEQQARWAVAYQRDENPEPGAFDLVRRHVIYGSTEVME